MIRAVFSGAGSTKRPRAGCSFGHDDPQQDVADDAEPAQHRRADADAHDGDVEARSGGEAGGDTAEHPAVAGAPQFVRLGRTRRRRRVGVGLAAVVMEPSCGSGRRCSIGYHPEPDRSGSYLMVVPGPFVRPSWWCRHSSPRASDASTPIAARRRRVFGPGRVDRRRGRCDPTRRGRVVVVRRHRRGGLRRVVAVGGRNRRADATPAARERRSTAPRSCRHRRGPRACCAGTSATGRATTSRCRR